MAIFPESVSMSIGEAGITAIFGYSVVFAGLVILMVLISAVGAYFKAKDKKAAAAAASASVDEGVVTDGFLTEFSEAMTACLMLYHASRVERIAVGALRTEGDG